MDRIFNSHASEEPVDVTCGEKVGVGKVKVVLVRYHRSEPLLT
jgi:hypothetical protein